MILYLLIIVCLFKRLPQSISETYYILGNKGWIFQVITSLLGICLFPIMINIGNYEHFIFLACGSFLFIAAAPQLKIKLEGKVHYISALICCISVLLWLLTNQYYLDIISALIILIILNIISFKRIILWIELVELITIYKVILFYYVNNI